MKDLFRPRTEPARTIYDAFQLESLKRKESNDPKIWIENERQVVFSVAKKYAETHNLVTPTIDQVTLAKRSAQGHIDYAAKWAYGIVDFMNNQ